MTSDQLHLHQASSVKGEVKRLPSSKSLSNRALILQAMAGSEKVVTNLSDARDTVLMEKLVDNPEKVIDVMDAGTTMRFLTAYFSVTGRKKIMTGTKRMKERPIKLLVDALRQLGVSIDYIENEGFPPIEIKGFEKQLTDSVTVPGNVSSQYISGLMMAGAHLKNGLTINLEGKVGSKPYIDMTAALMEHFGIKPEFTGSQVRVPHGTYKARPYRVEGDWSAASYWFAFAALSQSADLYLPGVSDKSLQGDRAIVDIMKKLGAVATFDKDGARVTKSTHSSELSWDFTDCPDLAQTVLPVCAAKGIQGTFTGLESLFIKETDRVAALRNELQKINARFEEPEKGKWRLIPGDFKTVRKIEVETYHDHRMAMGFAPLSMLMEVTIQSPDVVNKSYPGFWEDVDRTVQKG